MPTIWRGIVEIEREKEGFASGITVWPLLWTAVWGTIRMATVRCDVCGGIFSQSYLASHKRLAHTESGASTAAPATAPTTEEAVIGRIASLYESLSVNGRKRVIRLLGVKDQTIKDRRVQNDQKIQ
jgi:hypothetical protein